MTPGKDKLHGAAPTAAPHRSTLCRRRCLALFALTVGLSSLVGCGVGSAFTGGTVPIGKAALTGRVLRSENPLLPLANTQITLLATPAQSAAQTLHATTDQNGMFRVDNIPTDATTGTVTVIATPPAASDYSSQQVTFLISNRHTASLIFALPPASYQFVPGTTLSILPASALLLTGQSVEFTAQLRGTDGVILPFRPTLLFDDDFGTLNDDGTFTAAGSGTGDILAFWYNGLRASSAVIVNTNPHVLPPMPPAAPRTAMPKR